jgi:hypothetical protein
MEGNSDLAILMGGTIVKLFEIVTQQMLILEKRFPTITNRKKMVQKNNSVNVKDVPFQRI